MVGAAVGSSSGIAGAGAVSVAVGTTDSVSPQIFSSSNIGSVDGVLLFGVLSVVASVGTVIQDDSNEFETGAWMSTMADIGVRDVDFGSSSVRSLATSLLVTSGDRAGDMGAWTDGDSDVRPSVSNSGVSTTGKATAGRVVETVVCEGRDPEWTSSATWLDSWIFWGTGVVGRGVSAGSEGDGTETTSSAGPLRTSAASLKGETKGGSESSPEAHGDEEVSKTTLSAGSTSARTGDVKEGVSSAIDHVVCRDSETTSSICSLISSGAPILGEATGEDCSATTRGEGDGSGMSSSAGLVSSAISTTGDTERDECPETAHSAGDDVGTPSSSAGPSDSVVSATGKARGDIPSNIGSAVRMIGETKVDASSGAVVGECKAS